MLGMKGKWAIPVISGVLILGIIASGISVYADDLNKPTYRGAQNSLHFEWATSFFSPGLIPPDVFEAGPSSFELFDFTPFLGPGSEEGFLGLCISGFCNIGIPNFVDGLERKFIRVQVSYDGPTPTSALMFALDTNLGIESPCSLVDRVDLPGYYFEDWVCEPNPVAEAYAMLTTGGLTQIVIDTISFDGAEPPLSEKQQIAIEKANKAQEKADEAQEKADEAQAKADTTGEEKDQNKANKAQEKANKEQEKACNKITKEITQLDKKDQGIPIELVELQLVSCGP